MKGIAHFMVGLAAASCFPDAVRQAAEGRSLYMVLGGVFGLLPDTLDFKWARYFYRPDVQVAPDPLNPDMRDVAEAAALAARRVVETGKTCDLQLHTIRLGADRWRAYELTFDAGRQRVTAQLGSAVDTGGRPEPSVAPDRKSEAHAPLPGPVRLDYTATIRVDILDGPTVRMEPDDQGGVSLRFIPWHRRWSHSLILSLLLGAVGWALWDGLAGAVMLTAHAAHVLADQSGWMGGSLFYPFSKKRLPGWGCWLSGDRQVNLATVWLSCLLIFWNLYAQSDAIIPWFNPLKLFFWGALLPMGVAVLWRRCGAAEEQDTR